MFARAARALIAIALLAAQQAALGHQIWHLGAGAAQAAAGSAAGGDRGAPAPQERLCDLHASLGAVLGVLDCVAARVPATAADDIAFRFAELPAAAAPGPRPASRGPPALL